MSFLSENFAATRQSGQVSDSKISPLRLKLTLPNLDLSLFLLNVTWQCGRVLKQNVRLFWQKSLATGDRAYVNEYTDCSLTLLFLLICQCRNICRPIRKTAVFNLRYHKLSYFHIYLSV